MSKYRATPTWWDNGRNPDGSPAVRKVWTVEGPEPFGGLTAVDEAQAHAVVDLLNREVGDQGDDPDEGEACGRYIGPREPRFDAIKRYHLAMLGSNS